MPGQVISHKRIRRSNPEPMPHAKRSWSNDVSKLYQIKDLDERNIAFRKYVDDLIIEIIDRRVELRKHANIKSENQVAEEGFDSPMDAWFDQFYTDLDKTTLDLSESRGQIKRIARLPENQMKFSEKVKVLGITLKIKYKFEHSVFSF